MIIQKLSPTPLSKHGKSLKRRTPFKCILFSKDTSAFVEAEASPFVSTATIGYIFVLKAVGGHECKTLVLIGQLFNVANETLLLHCAFPFLRRKCRLPLLVKKVLLFPYFKTLPKCMHIDHVIRRTVDEHPSVPKGGPSHNSVSGSGNNTNFLVEREMSKAG